MKNRDAAICYRAIFQPIQKGFEETHVVTEILPVKEFYYAEDFHQQYLFKNPEGYCGIGGTGVACPIGLQKTNK